MQFPQVSQRDICLSRVARLLGESRCLVQIFGGALRATHARPEATQEHVRRSGLSYVTRSLRRQKDVCCETFALFHLAHNCVSHPEEDLNGREPASKLLPRVAFGQRV